jgi:hypothetical protein
MFHGLGRLGELTPSLRAGGSISIASVLLGLTCYQPTGKGVSKDRFEQIVRIRLQSVSTRKETQSSYLNNLGQDAGWFFIAYLYFVLL